ncbi:hypothetical protein [Allorhodopirellula heiligendammensis]|uniref:Uncharacterized protein n=1 Tax=Allorhodopirellula heiligendammensis TaxID=2714739 RepID=A0A5C6C6N9_9BACT|nr:hypothetical protein [Allorhodopirellula heiligendammensis]TWU19742.1 hypothetical protein Poly21_19180 [Allorhodopirellula heiligendammensis]
MLINFFAIGQFVHLDGSGVGVVVMLPDDTEVPDGHIGVWFGTTTETGRPVICTVPIEYIEPTPDPIVQH